jgi:drug/metabolite transporter (DMT)-like permease
VTTIDTARRRVPLSGQALGIILVLISAAGFGSGALFVQPLYDAGMDTVVVMFWRFTTAALFSWGFLALSSRRRDSLRSLSPRRVVILLLLGTLYVGNSFAFFASLQVVSISLASIITYLYPAIVAVMATRLVRRLEGRRAWVALGISIVGVALTVGGIPAGDLPPLWGLALAFANPLIYATWIVLQARLAGERPAKRAAHDGSGAGSDLPATIEIPPADADVATDAPDPSPAAALMTTATAIAYALLLLGSGGSVSPDAVPHGAWPAVLGLGLVATAIAIQAFYAGVKRVGGARASLISTVEPVYTVALAVVLFGEQLTAMQLAGGALVIFAVLLAETGRPDTVARTEHDRA